MLIPPNTSEFLFLTHLGVGVCSLHVQEASTAKLLIFPLHGSPNVSIETPILQLFDPMQACKLVLVSVSQLKAPFETEKLTEKVEEKII